MKSIVKQRNNYFKFQSVQGLAMATSLWMSTFGLVLTVAESLAVAGELMMTARTSSLHATDQRRLRLAQGQVAPADPPKPESTPGPAEAPAKQIAPSVATVPNANGAKTETDARRDVVLAVRGGMQASGEITPKNLLVGKTTPGFIVVGDLSRRVDGRVSFGAFALLSRSSYKRYIYETVEGVGDLTLISAGSTLKTHFEATPGLILRFGATVGPNLIFISVNQDGTTYDAHGWGLNVGATAEASLRVNDVWRLSLQIGFTSQIAGQISIENDSNDHDLKFPPLFFVAVGPEWNL